ncbi:O-antigen polymerase, partial [Shigella boydii]|nr:O-antigen polymerase [Shigella boydii]
IIFLFLIVLFFFRNEDFGADTQNYLNEFDEYCSNPSGYIGVDYTYKYIFDLINFLMLDSCHISWLIWIWPIFVIGCIFLAITIFRVDKIYIIALFSSFIGIELLTNALRQGFSIAVLLLSFCLFIKRRYFLFLIAVTISFLFHQASILIVSIFIISRCSIRIVVPSIVVGVFLLFATNILDVVPWVIEFKKLIYKYLPYADEDFIIRIISIINTLCLCVLYLIVMIKSHCKDKIINNIVINATFVCCIASIVPYLGFRIIYGVYPLLLLLTYCSIRNYIGRVSSYNYLSLSICINIFISIMWLCGSSHMNKIPFVSIII